MPAAAPVEIPLLLACSVAEQVAVLAVSVLVLVLVEDATEVVDVAPLSKRSVEMAAFITARYAPVEKFCLWQLFRLPQAKVLEAQAHTPQWALETPPMTSSSQNFGHPLCSNWLSVHPPRYHVPSVGDRQRPLVMQ